MCRKKTGEIITLIDSDLRKLNCPKSYSKSCKHQSHKKLRRYNNDYEVQEDYVIMYTQKGEPFYVDLEDFWKVKNITWRINQNGYVVAYADGQNVLLHRVVMNAPNDVDVDHKYGRDTRNDNRKYNLRLCNQSQNERNKGLRKDNKSGCTGVWWDRSKNKWLVNISLYGKKLFLGRYSDYDVAVEVRKKAEQKYFGEWSYDDSQK